MDHPIIPITREQMKILNNTLYSPGDLKEKERITKVNNIVREIYRKAFQFAKNTKNTRFGLSICPYHKEMAPCSRDVCGYTINKCDEGYNFYSKNTNDIIQGLSKLFPDSKVYRHLECPEDEGGAFYIMIDWS